MVLQGGTGPSLEVTLGIDRIAVCVGYEDASTGKSYDCSPFFIDIDEATSDPNYCTTNPSSCYCSLLTPCIDDFTSFCDQVQPTITAQADLTLIIDSANTSTPRLHNLLFWSDGRKGELGCTILSNDYQLNFDDGTSVWQILLT